MQEYSPFFQGEKRSVTEKLAKFFEQSDLESKIHFDEEKLVYILSVPTDKEKEAKKLYQAFYFAERERIENMENDESNSDSLEEYDQSNVINGNLFDEDISEEVKEEIALSESSSSDIPSSENPEDSQDTQDTEETPDSTTSLFSGSGSYVMKSEKYNDYRGTFFIFLFMGIAGLIFVILNITEVLTLLYGIFPNTIMGALFLFFIYVGISTGIKAKQLRYEIEEENQLTEKINSWLSKNITKEFLSSISNKDISVELDYIKKAETIRDMLLKEFGDLNPDYLDRLIEEYYSENFDMTEN
ncbi:MAG: hypothetical protein GX237_03495 [Clostridiales bacterium]|nr:hypothetical protein [Clostridiales bacterium]